jgi:hypothetical protein
MFLPYALLELLHVPTECIHSETTKAMQYSLFVHKQKVQLSITSIFITETYTVRFVWAQFLVDTFNEVSPTKNQQIKQSIHEYIIKNSSLSTHAQTYICKITLKTHTHTHTHTHRNS